MSMNGVYGYSYNPYAYNNAYSTNTTSFQGYNTTTNEKEDDGVSLGVIAAIGTGLAAIGTTIYAIKRGKLLNTTDDAARGLKNIFDGNVRKGLREVGEDLLTGLKSIFTKSGRKEYGYVKQIKNSQNLINAIQNGTATAETLSKDFVENAARTKVIEEIRSGSAALTSIYDDAGNKLTGEALETAKKTRINEFNAMVEAAKTSLTEEDYLLEATKEAYQAGGKLGYLQTAKNLLNKINSNQSFDAEDTEIIQELFSKTGAVADDGTVNIEALKPILERIA